MTVSLRWSLPAVFLLAFLIRTPLLGLPLEGESAGLAAAAAHLADEGEFGTLEYGPVTSAVIAGTLRGFGVSPTVSLRWVDVLAAALLAPLVLVLGQRLGLGRRAATVAAVLFGLHPLGVLAAGGLEPGSGSLAALLTLGALTLVSSRHAWARRAGLVPIVLLCGTHGSAAALVPPLLVLQALRESRPRLQTMMWMTGAVVLTGALATWIEWGAFGHPWRGLLWPAAATLGVLALGLPRGLRRFAAHPVGRTGLAMVLLAAGGWLIGQPFPALTVLPLVILVGIAGFETALDAAALPRPRLARRLLRVAGVGSAVLTLGLVSGGVQAALVPQAPAKAGRLHLLREAVQAAAAEAGTAGWIVLAVAADRPEEQASLADLNPGHWTWAHAPQDDTRPREALRRLPVFPAASFASGRHVAVVALAGQTAAIQTFGGSGIYKQELVRRVGPYVVLRAQRP